MADEGVGKLNIVGVEAVDMEERYLLKKGNALRPRYNSHP
jgi:hypothetical protein